MFVPVSRAIIKDEQAYVWEHDRRFTGPFLVSFSTNHVETMHAIVNNSV